MTPRKSPRPKPSEIVPLPIHCSEWLLETKSNLENLW